MLKGKAFYRIIALFALIVLFAVAAVKTSIAGENVKISKEDIAAPSETERTEPVAETKERQPVGKVQDNPVIKTIDADSEKVSEVLEGLPPDYGEQSTASESVDNAEANRGDEVKTNSVPAELSEELKEAVLREHEEKPEPANTLDGTDSADVPNMAGVAEPESTIEGTKERIALLPFDNFSDNNEALDIVMPLIMKQLDNSGYDVIDDAEVEAFLCERHIRQASFISRDVAAALGNNKMVKTALAGSVLTFSTDGNPKIGILARRLDLMTGRVIWSHYVSLTGEDYTRVLGLGTIKAINILVPHAVNKLFATLGNQSHEKDINAKYKIAVLPFKNESKHRHAGMIITHLFQNELANNPMFDPVDYGDVKKTIVSLRVGHKGEVDYNNLQALSKSLGVDVVLTGTVEEYEAGQEYSSPPVVTIAARLLDSRSNRILWYENIHMDGEENIVALDWGRLRSADKVAYGAVSDLVNNIKKENPLRP